VRCDDVALPDVYESQLLGGSRVHARDVDLELDRRVLLKEMMLGESCRLRDRIVDCRGRSVQI
jgi:hypothetical protein